MSSAMGGRLRNHLRWQYALLFIALVAGVLRFYGLEKWPVFLDEDLYTWRSFEVGRLPLQQALMYAVVKPPLAFFLQDALARFAFDHLIAGRVLSAMAGTLTTVLTFYLGRRLGGVSAGLIAASIYAVAPIAVLHERMVLQDGPMAMLALSAVLVSWRAIERESWSLTGFAALLGAIAVQIKVPAIAISVVPIMLFFTFNSPWLSRKAAIAIVGSLGPVLSYLALRLSPLGPGLAFQESSRAEPLSSFWANMDTLRDAILTYFPAGLPFLVLVGIVLTFQRNRRLAFVFMAVFLAWSVPWLTLSNFAPSRYYLPVVPYACALAAIACVWLVRAAASLGRVVTGIAAVASVSIVAASGVASVQLVLDHSVAPMTRLDDWQYRSGWPSGYGYGDAAQFIDDTAKPGSAVAYVVDPAHRVGAGFIDPLPEGVTSLGLVDARDQLPANHAGPLYVIVDNGRDDVSGRLLQQVLAKEPGLWQRANYAKPGSKIGVSVWYLPLPSVWHVWLPSVSYTPSP